MVKIEDKVIEYEAKKDKLESLREIEDYNLAVDQIKNILPILSILITNRVNSIGPRIGISSDSYRWITINGKQIIGWTVGVYNRYVGIDFLLYLTADGKLVTNKFSNNCEYVIIEFEHVNSVKEEIDFNLSRHAKGSLVLKIIHERLESLRVEIA